MTSSEIQDVPALADANWTWSLIWLRVPLMTSQSNLNLGRKLKLVSTGSSLSRILTHDEGWHWVQWDKEEQLESGKFKAETKQGLKRSSKLILMTKGWRMTVTAGDWWQKRWLSRVPDRSGAKWRRFVRPPDERSGEKGRGSGDGNGSMRRRPTQCDVEGNERESTYSRFGDANRRD